ncbi:EAL domain-containing protein [Zooshikella marina]|uniref:EAL domain-containing response regulator n=1 Tax=Zooshikella ganghwensis TaxID=202772 RepID=UPI001BAFC336|nr:EAL domain-containing protein [Zooshikella ganghwensis]MBU2706217.1 EAL domain-containing protein [Zooshikella ganghwensis]
MQQVEANTIRLLIIEASQNEAEQIVSLFRNAGRATRAHRVTSVVDLEEVLNGQLWDLLIASHPMDEINGDQALSAVKKLNKDLPVILLQESYDSDKFTEALQQGYKDIVLYGEERRLVLVSLREVDNLQERRMRRKAEVSLREAEKRCQLLLNSSVDAIAYVHDGMHIYVNKSYVELFGYDDPEEMEGLPIIDLLASEDQAQFKSFLKNYQQGENNSEDLVCHGVKADDSKFKARMSFSPATYDGEPCTQLIIRVDKGNAELEEKLKEISTQDLVTGLYNRQFFTEQLEKTVERAIDCKGNSGLFYISLDNFDEVRAQIGLADSDLVLADISSLLKAHITAPNIISRYGDNIFMALLNTDNQDSLSSLAKAICKNVEDHLSEVSGRTVQIKVSIGITIVNETTNKVKEILDFAQKGTEKAKSEGENKFAFYTAQDDLAELASEGNVLAMIQQGLEKNDFKLLFQPIISLRGDSEEHYEVLLRLYDNDGKEIPTKEIFTTADKAKLAAKVDRWVILQSIKLLAVHRAKGHSTRLFIHISGPSLQDKTLVPWVSVALKAARLPSDSLIFQISEEDATTYLKQAKELTKALGELHCKVALTHFGCAINPFNNLKHLTVDYVKTDGSFTQDLSNPETQENLKTMISSLHSQGKLTIVPLVENASVLATLWQAGVNYIQGYYLQGPVSEMDYDFSSDDE